MALRKKPVTIEQARLKMASLCSRAEQCEFDILKKLINLGLSEADRKDIISSLKSGKYLDNERYARSFAIDKARFSHWGPLKIKAALYAKRIKSDIINEALGEVDKRIWVEAIMKSAETKARTLSLTGNEGREDRQKLFAFLIRRGFSSDYANKAVRIMKRRQEDNEEVD